jgi:hypothetical protein
MTTSTRTRIAAALLVAGSLAFTLGDLLRRLVEPAGSPDPVDITRAVGQHHAAWLSAGLLAVVAGLCLAPAALALVPTAGSRRSRGARATMIGAVMTAIGAMASIGHAVAFYAPYALFAQARTERADVTAIDAASESWPLLTVLIALFIVGMMLGPIVLLGGLRRARRVPVWSVVAAVVFAACGSAGSAAAGVLGTAAALAAFVPAARAVLRGETATADDRPTPEEPVIPTRTA